jgi:hypothetical protein
VFQGAEPPAFADKYAKNLTNLDKEGPFLRIIKEQRFPIEIIYFG